MCFPEKLIKTINICYEKKYKLSEIANLIINDSTKINIIDSISLNKNYSIFSLPLEHYIRSNLLPVTAVNCFPSKSLPAAL